MVRPLLYFDSDGLQTFDQAPTDDFEGVTDFELNDIHFLNLGVNARPLVGDAEWVLVATGRFDLPRLHELATRYAGLSASSYRMRSPYFS